MRVEATGEFRGWIDTLKDRTGRARILVRIDRLIHGVGPGYRVYYTLRGTRLLLLLAGGDKSSQKTDIVRAVRLAREFQE